MIIQFKNLPRENLAKWHICDKCRLTYNFWDNPLEFEKIKNWWTDTEQHGVELCYKCYPIESKKGRRCKKCGNTNIFMLRTNDTTCTECLSKSIQQLCKKERKKIERVDQREKMKGFLYKAEIWIHPEQGGDDYQIDVYYKYKPTKAEVSRTAKSKGSCVLNDFHIAKL